MKVVWNIILLLFGHLAIVAQNLVPNPGFEAYLQCPPYPGQIHLAEAWDAPNHQTTDFFHGCAPFSTGAGVPANLVGEQVPHSGDGYAGLRTWVPVIDGNPPYREYLSVALVRPLQAGRDYLFRCWISVAEASSHFSDGVGFLLTEDPLQNQAIYTQEPQLRFIPGVPLEEQQDWVSFSAVYKSKGGEQYLTIGNFQIDTELLLLKDNEQSPTVYYYIDDVSITPCRLPERFESYVDTFVCQDEAILLAGQHGALSYLWSDSRTVRERWVEQPGEYSLITDWVCYQTTTRFNVQANDCSCDLSWSNPFGPDGQLNLPLQLLSLELNLYDAAGRLVGRYDESSWVQLRDWYTSGIYFWKARLDCGGEVRHRVGKVILVK